MSEMSLVIYFRQVAKIGSKSADVDLQHNEHNSDS